MKVSGFDHIVICVDDVDRTLDFYDRVGTYRFDYRWDDPLGVRHTASRTVYVYNGNKPTASLNSIPFQFKEEVLSSSTLPLVSVPNLAGTLFTPISLLLPYW